MHQWPLAGLNCRKHQTCHSRPVLVLGGGGGGGVQAGLLGPVRYRGSVCSRDKLEHVSLLCTNTPCCVLPLLLSVPLTLLAVCYHSCCLSHKHSLLCATTPAVCPTNTPCCVLPLLLSVPLTLLAVCYHSCCLSHKHSLLCATTPAICPTNTPCCVLWLLLSVPQTLLAVCYHSCYLSH